MNRTEFLMKMGLHGAALLAVLTACQPEGVVEPGGPVDFDLDLNEPVNASLLTNGGFVICSNVVVARTTVGKLVAVSRTCSHQGQKQITFGKDEFYCNAHGARFNQEGVGLNANGQRGLKTYRVSQTGTIVRVYS